MKSLSCFVLCLILLPIISFAQAGKKDTPPPFLYLHNGTLLKEGEFETKGGFFGKRFRYNNGDKINFNDIKFYQGEDGYFANYYGRFAACTETGTFDLFTLIEENTYHDNDGYAQTSSIKRYLYTKDFGDLKPLNYDNLKADFSVFPNSDHPQEEKIILGLLEQGKQRRKTKMVVLLSGISGFVVGTALYTSVVGQNNSDGFTLKNKGLAASGLSISLGGLVTSVVALVLPKESKSYLESLRTYNQTY
ncbi:MAG: hypothetical protein HUU01_14380 [Saprospiraceae bacterium]|nr:hypothetical protein [Saprospiraceae bacterium]